MQSPRTWSTMSAVGLLLVLSAVAVPVNAGSRGLPEISDPVGDANPASSAAQVPSDASIIQHADLYDLHKVYIAAEDRDSVVLRMEVADIPDDWLLPAGPASGEPIDPIRLDDQEVVWTDQWMNSKIVLTTHFSSKGQSYRVVATLAELSLDNPNEFPGANSAMLISERFNGSRLVLQQQHKIIQELLLPGLGALSLRAAMTEQIAQARASLDAAHAELNETEDWNDAPPEAREGVVSSIGAARAAMETARAGVVDKIPLSTPRQDMAAGFDQIDLKLKEASVLASALPTADSGGDAKVGAAADPKAPQVLLFANYRLVNATGFATPLAGAIDVASNHVQVQIPKASIGSPLFSDWMEKLRAESRFRTNMVLDYAPNVLNPQPGDSPESLVMDAQSGRLVKLTYGSTYVFSYKPPAGPSGGGAGSEPYAGSALKVTMVGADSQNVHEGGVATYYVSLKNEGVSDLQGVYSLSPAQPGWTHHLSESEWSLASGSSRMLTVSVSAIDGGSAQQVSALSVIVQDGQPRSVVMTTNLIAEDLEVQEAPQKGDTPGPGLWLVIGAVAAAMLLRRTRP